MRKMIDEEKSNVLKDLVEQLMGKMMSGHEGSAHEESLESPMEEKMEEEVGMEPSPMSEAMGEGEEAELGDSEDEGDLAKQEVKDFFKKSNIKPKIGKSMTMIAKVSSGKKPFSKKGK